jgi:phosphate transport system substrate-binding protein
MRYLVTLLLVSFFMMTGCDSHEKKAQFDTPLSGTIRISVDETFKPVIEEQIKMYELSYPGTKIIADYKPEIDCIRDFFSDSAVRLVLVSRALTRKEEKYLADSLHYIPGCQPVASDAVALVIHKASTDSLFTIKGLQDALSGKENSGKVFVFDGLNATSTVRYIRDSIMKGEIFDTSMVKAVRSSKEVLEYVAEHENSVGFTGVSWIGNKEDSSQRRMLEKVKLAYVRCELCEGKPYVKPMQESMLTRRYPLVRKLYYMIHENYTGLGTGFTSFLKFERGQLIFRRAYLGPVMDLDIRNVQVNERIPEN